MKYALLLVLIGLSSSVLADYVSPTKYKDYSCKELIEERVGWYEEMKAQDNDYLDYALLDKSRALEAEKQSAKAEAHLKAIDKVKNKIKCK